jgi:hypothetical protein
MALSKVEIGNLALAEVPAPFMTSFEDVTPEATQIRNAYQPSLEALLDLHDFDFAIKRISLAAITNARGDEWGFAYSLPSDLISPRFLRPVNSTTSAASTIVAGLQTVAYPVLAGFPVDEMVNLYPFVIADGTLYTNLSDAVLEYTSGAISEASFPPLFARALSIEIAARVVYPLTQNAKRQDYLVGMAQVARERAIADDMNRQPRETFGFFSDETISRTGAP